MSYRESNITVSCVSYLLVLGYYLVNWLRMYQEEGLNSSEIFLLWVIVIIATIVSEYCRQYTHQHCAQHCPCHKNSI